MHIKLAHWIIHNFPVVNFVKDKRNCYALIDLTRVYFSLRKLKKKTYFRETQQVYPSHWQAPRTRDTLSCRYITIRSLRLARKTKHGEILINKKGSNLFSNLWPTNKKYYSLSLDHKSFQRIKKVIYTKQTVLWSICSSLRVICPLTLYMVLEES